MNRYGLTDLEWSVIELLLPNKPQGVSLVVRSLWWDATRCSGRHIASYISRHQLKNLNE